MEKLKKIDKYFILFVLIVAFYCFYLSHFGFELWDTGYITSFSWRIANGENVYQDFIYKGPPVTLYFHAFFIKILPEIGQFYLIRVVNYLLFAFQVCFSVLAFNNFYNLKDFKINKWALISVCFIISLLNFPPYPWPTTDGLLFSSIAIYFLSLKSQKPITLFIIALFSLLSALTKQSFYPIPLLIFVWIFINYDVKKVILFSAFLILQIGVFLYWINSFTTIEKFIHYTTGETTIVQLLHSGFLNYFWIYGNRWLVCVIIMLCSIVLFVGKTRLKAINFKLFFKITSIVLVLFSLILCLIHDFLNASRITFLSTIFGLLFFLNFKLKTFQYYSTSILLLGIAWCSSISLGYPFPILYSTGIILTLVILYKNELDVFRKTQFYLPSVITLCLFAFSYTIHPYREKEIFKLNYKLDEISTKLVGIKSTKSNFEKLKDLKQLKIKYGNQFIVAPNIPIAHYLFNTNSILPADWIINSEINKNPKLFVEIAADKKNYIFLEKSFLNGEELMPPRREDFSIIADYIYKNFRQINETKYFIIYNGINKNEALHQIN